MMELQNVITSNSNGIWWGMIQLTSVPVFSDVVDIFLSSVVVLTPNGNFCFVPVLHSVSDMP